MTILAAVGGLGIVYLAVRRSWNWWQDNSCRHGCGMRLRTIDSAGLVRSMRDGRSN